MKEKNGIIVDFTKGSVPKQLFFFALPLILSGLLQTVYNMVDMIIVGQAVGRIALSAVSIGGDVLMLLTFVSMGFSNASQVIISQYIGAGERKKVSRMIGTLFVFMLLCALFMTALCLLLHNQILRWINTPPEAWDYARAYVETCICGLVFIYGYNLVSAILRGMGDSRRPFLFVAIASVVNLALDLLFVVGFHWGTFGAALATVIGQAFSFICSLAVLYRERKDFGFDFHPSSFRIDGEQLRTLLKLGIPMVIQSAAITFSKLFVNSWVNSYGVIAAAVTGIGNKLESVVNTFSQALTTAGSAMTAQNIGAGKHERVPKIMLTTFIMDSVIAVSVALTTAFFPEKVFGVFCSDAEILAVAMTFIPVALLLYFGSMLRVPMFSLINGSGNSKLNLTVALLDGIIIRIGLALFLGVTCGMGIYGFWYGNAISGFVPFFIGGAYFLQGGWKRHNAIHGGKRN